MVLNGSESRQIASVRRLATMLLMGCLVVASSGCLLPEDFFRQDDPVFPMIPDSLNLPPLILDNGLKPVQQVGTFQIGQTCAQEFQIIVQDDSPAIQHQWFIDAAPSFSPSGDVGTTQFGTSSTLRVLRPPSGLFSRLLTLKTSESGAPAQHRVSVVITDGNFTEVNNIIGFTPTQKGKDENGTLVDQPPFHLIYTWFVTLRDCV